MANRNNLTYSLLFIFCFFANFLCFFARVNISVAAPEMIRQGLSEAEMGIVLSAFFWGYISMQIPGAILAERYGGKSVLSYGVLFFSFFSMLTPLTFNVWVMSIIRSLVGAGQGANYPCITNIISRFAKASQVARLQGFTLSGAHIGTMTALPVGTIIINYYGWPSIFYVTGFLGFIWYILFSLTTRKIKNTTEISHSSIPWAKLLTDRVNRYLYISFFSHNYAAYFFMAWLPTYLVQVHGFSLVSMGFIAMVPSLVAFLFVNLSGWLSDILAEKLHSKVYSRVLLIYLGMGCAGISVALIPFSPSPYLAVLLIAVCQGFRSISTPAYWALTIDLGGNRASVVASLMNTTGNMAGIVAPMLSGFLVAYFKSWDLAIYICSLIIFGGTLFMVPFAKRTPPAYEQCKGLD